jgi:hypothetical protein
MAIAVRRPISTRLRNPRDDHARYADGKFGDCCESRNTLTAHRRELFEIISRRSTRSRPRE